MLSMINLLKDYQENKKRYVRYLKTLEKDEIYEIFKQAHDFEAAILYKHLQKDTLITMLDLLLHRLTVNQKVLYVAPELKYKGKYPEKHKKNISKIAEQLDINGDY